MVQPQPDASANAVLQELLLALLGHTGDVFVDHATPQQAKAAEQPDPWKCTWKLARDVTWISSSDRDVLEELVTLGFHFRCLESFVAQERAHANVKTGSLYPRALATGLSELLDVYAAAILQVQQHVMRDPCPTLAGLQFFLSDFKVLLPPLHALVYEVCAKRLAGSGLLQLLHYKAQCGVPVLQSCLSRLLWHCNQVLYKQLSAWMVHGLLADRQGEFFIQRAMPAEGEDALETVGGWTGASTAQHSTAAYEWHRGYQVAVSALPPHITLATAESVLFVGKAVQVLQQPGRGGAKPSEAPTTTTSATAAGRQDTLAEAGSLSSGAGGLGLPALGFAGLPQGDVLAAGEALRRLAHAPTFYQNDFERTIEAIRVKVAGELWSLVVVAGELPAHLAALKDYFLCAKGDLWQAFLLESYTLMRLPPRLATAEGDLAIPFQQSALKSTAEHDRLFPNVKLRFAAPEPGGIGAPASGADADGAAEAKKRSLHVPAYDKWDNVSLAYKVDWPLHLLLTPEVMVKYGLMFQYLLRLKRIQLDLEDAWAVMRRWGSGSGEVRVPARDRVLDRASDMEAGTAARLPLWQVRHHMAHIITNLQIYIQVDVIEAQHALLMDRIGAAHDFSAAQRAHRAFLDALVGQAFLDVRPITQMLEAIFLLCQRMCGIIQKDDGSPDSDAANPMKVAGLASDFRRRAALLYGLLQSAKLAGSGRAPYLRQLLLRLNFNGYIEREAARQLRL